VEITVGVLAGGFINLLFTRRSSQELRWEAERLQRHTTLILNGLEEAGLVEYTRDERGEVVGMVIHLRGSAHARSASGTLTVSYEEDDTPADQE